MTIAEAKATDITLSWTAPTSNTDGSSPAVISGYNIYVAPTDAALTAMPNTMAGAKATVSAGNVLAYKFVNVVPGTYFYAVTVWYCDPNHSCTESVQSGHATATVKPPVIVTKTATAPGSVTVSATLTATTP